jgi:DNA-binding response OmpR family regulator
MEEPVLIINTIQAAPVTSYVLERAGFVTETVSDTETAAERLADGAYRAAVLLTAEDASAGACERVRRASGAPLIVISPGMSTEACVRAIEAGADFCLRRPFGPLELAARIRALGQRPGRTREAAVPPLG